MKKSVIKWAALCLCVLMAAAWTTGCAPNPKKSEGGESDAAATPSQTPGETPETTSIAGGQQQPVRVGVLLKTLKGPYWTHMQDGIKEQLTKMSGVSIDIVGPTKEGDAAEQLQMLKDMVAGGKYDAIAVAPMTPDNCIEGVVQAGEKGVVIVNIDVKFNTSAFEGTGGHVVGYTTSDNIKVGKTGAGLITEALGKEGGGVVIIQGAVGAEEAELRRDGCKETLTGKENIEILAVEAGDGDRQKALAIATRLIGEHGDKLNAIYATDEAMALGVLEAMHNADRMDIVLVGTDAGDETKTAIKQGEMSAVIQLPGEVGVAAVEMAVKAVREGGPIMRDEPPEERLIRADVLTPKTIQ